MTDFDDLLIPEPAAPLRQRRRAKSDAQPDTLAARIKAAGAGKTDLRVTDFLQPVTQNFLATVFSMDPQTVRRRLVRCPSIGEARNGKALVYDFKEACAYLLKPKMDLDTYLATLNPADMPNQINRTYWEAKRIRLKYEIEAGLAWATEDVLETFGRVFMACKTHSQLWLEGMRDLGLDDDQLLKVGQLVDAFNANLYDELIELPSKRRTRPKIAELEQELAAIPNPDSDDENGID